MRPKAFSLRRRWHGVAVTDEVYPHISYKTQSFVGCLHLIRQKSKIFASFSSRRSLIREVKTLPYNPPRNAVGVDSISAPT